MRDHGRELTETLVYPVDEDSDAHKISVMTPVGAALIGALAGWIELGERPNASELIGMALIVGALAMISLWSLVQSRRA